MWQKTYTDRITKRKLVGIAASSFVVSAVALGIHELTRKPLGIKWGVIVLISGTFILTMMRSLLMYFRTHQTVTCERDEFKVVTKRKYWGTQTQRYKWHEVTGTRYYEMTFRGSIIGYFLVATSRGEALNMADEETNNFPEMIDTFNEMTKHLPYGWIKEKANSHHVLEEHGAYSKVARK